MFALDALLSRAREECIELALLGQEPDENFWTLRERNALKEIRRRFYCPAVQDAVQPKNIEPRPSKDIQPEQPERGPQKLMEEEVESKDLGQNGQKLLACAIWMTHDIIKEIPFVCREFLHEG